MPAESNRDIEAARALYLELRQIFDRREAGHADARMLRQVRRLCDGAERALADPYCQKRMAELARYADDFFSTLKHRRWTRGSTPGTVFLRRLVFRALDAFDTRLANLESLRRAEIATAQSTADR